MKSQNIMISLFGGVDEMMWKIPIALSMTGIVFGMLILWHSTALPEYPKENVVCSFSQEQCAQYQPFPVVLEDQLVIQSLGGYEGPYLEDGTYEEVSDVVAVMVHNTGKTTIKNTNFTLKTAQGIYKFQGRTILPDQTCVLLELAREPYRGESAAVCIGSVVAEDRENMLDSCVSVAAGQENTVVVSNISNGTVEGLCLYYKTYLLETDTLIGGLTYQVELQTLLPGQSQALYLPYYAEGYSKIVAAYIK